MNNRGNGIDKVDMKLNAMVASGKLAIANDISKEYWHRIKDLKINTDEYFNITQYAKYIGVTEEFDRVIKTFPDDESLIPAGFEPRLVSEDGKSISVDLRRNISYGCDGELRPTKVLLSADSANPYEVEPMKNVVANLTCNPAIIYDKFINDPSQNVGGVYKDRDEVITEIARILGPGADISVEVNDPFADESAIFDEIERFKEILSPYRLVVKIPHTGPLNKENVEAFKSGKFSMGYLDGSVQDNMYGINLASRLQEKGYRVNFTLMFEPYQAALSLQAKPYFINTFIRSRYQYNLQLKVLLAQYDTVPSAGILANIRNLMLQDDIITKQEAGNDSFVLERARWMVQYSNVGNEQGSDGLDSTRHSLRVLRNSNLPETRLILCSMDGHDMYPNIDKMLLEPEFSDMIHRVVVTAPPKYLSRYTSSPGVLTYQRLFLNAVK